MVTEKTKVLGVWGLVAKDESGKILWEDHGKNLIVDEGLDYLLGNSLSGSSMFIGLTDSAPTVAGSDTMASHAGWSEVAAYSESDRQAWTTAAVSSQSLTNSASVARFTATSTVTVGGAFLTTSNVKSGTAGTLFNVKAANGGDQVLNATDVLEITLSVSLASS